MKKTLCQADLCDQVFSGCLPYTKEELQDYREKSMGRDPAPKEAMAIAAYVKNHRINNDNVADVINVMWPATAFHLPHSEAKNGEFEVEIPMTFPDGSHGIMTSTTGNGIFDSYESMGWSDDN